MSTVYLVVSAVHIFEWITRTPELKLIRGASGALREETSEAAILRQFPDLRWCDAAGDVDGVVAVELPSGSTVRDAPGWADKVVRYLARRLPAVNWEAWWAESDEGYLAAYLDYEDARLAGMDGAGSVDGRGYLPRALEPPIAATCAGCRREPAHTQATDGDRLLGADCAVRDAAQKEARKGTKSARQAWTFDRLAEAGGLTPEERGRPGRQRSRNHLATIHADGNGVGGLMSALTEQALTSGRLAALRSDIVVQIDDATKEAYAAANRAISRGAELDGAILHFGGGDDLLVSVAAPQAWDFVMVLASSFERELATRLKSYTADLQRIGLSAGSVSLGIGMVFAHTAHPFADARSSAFDAMKQAKALVGGAEAAVSWLDLTAEHELPARRRVTLATLLNERRTGSPVAALERSARASLAEILRDFADPAPELRRWSKRTGKTVPLDNLADDLSRARWWPTTPIPKELQP